MTTDNRMTIKQAREIAANAGFSRSLSWWNSMVHHRKIFVTKKVIQGRTHNMIDDAELKRVMDEKPGLKVIVQSLAFFILLSAAFCGSAFAVEPLVDIDKIGVVESCGGEAILGTIKSCNKTDSYNPQTKATGLFQITPIAMQDFKQETGSRWTLDDMYSEDKAAHVALWLLEVRIPQILRSKKKAVNCKNILIGYNCGYKQACFSEKHRPEQTKDYIRKYEKL